MATPQSGWIIDKKVPVAVIFAMIVQTFAIVWWVATADARIRALENAMATFDVGAHNRESRIQILEREVPLIRQNIQSIDKTTDRIEKKLDKLSMNWQPKDQTVYAPPLPLEEMTLAQLMEIRTV